jgi:hypothetical protein
LNRYSVEVEQLVTHLFTDVEAHTPEEAEAIVEGWLDDGEAAPDNKEILSVNAVLEE